MSDTRLQARIAGTYLYADESRHDYASGEGARSHRKAELIRHSHICPGRDHQAAVGTRGVRL